MTELRLLVSETSSYEGSLWIFWIIRDLLKEAQDVHIMQVVNKSLFYDIVPISFNFLVSILRSAHQWR